MSLPENAPRPSYWLSAGFLFGAGLMVAVIVAGALADLLGVA